MRQRLQCNPSLKNAANALTIFSSILSVASLSRAMGFPSTGQRNTDRCSLVNFALYSNRSAMLLDNLLDDRQAEARTKALRAEEWLEDFRKYIRRDAGPRIFDHQHCPIGSPGLNYDLAFPIRWDLHRLRGVFEQIA